MKKRNKPARGLAAALAGALLLPMLAPAARAAAPQPSTDEAVYVNLDEYGGLSAMRVVKGVTLNGASSLSDYGQYAEVNNMTSHDKPKLREDGVDFSLESVTGSRFYYECIPSDPASLQMPWTFDVSYKLDGVPAKAEDLAGAKGLVEISIHAIPNPNADEYYRNNMTLLLGTGVDMDETKSLEAPGAQIQSMGSYKFAVFLGLPGEEDTYTVRIGSDRFESMGIYMLMAPATLSQLDTISDLRQARDKLEGAHDDLYKGLSDLLDTMDGMQGGIQSMADGITGINEVRRQLIAARGTIDPDLDAALQQLELLAGSSDALIPELDTAQKNLNAFHEHMTAVLDNLKGSREDVGDYQKLLQDVRANLADIRSLLDDVDGVTGEDWLNLEAIRSAVTALRKDTSALQDELSDLRGELDNMETIGWSLNSILQTIAGLDPNAGAVIDLISGDLQSIIGQLDDLNEPAQNSIMATESMLSALGKLLSASDSALEQLQALDTVLEGYKGTGQDTAALGEQAATLAEGTLARLDELLAQIQPIQQTLDEANEDANAAVPKIKDASTALTGTLKTSNTLLTDTRDTLRALRDQSDKSTQQSMDGLIDVMRRAANAGGTTDSLQTATDSIHNTISDEVDDIEDDSNLLEIDNSLALRSFTSGENPSPSSLQFILRTSEIAVDEMAEVQAEAAAETDVGVWGRIVSLFQKIAQAIASIF